MTRNKKSALITYLVVGLGFSLPVAISSFQSNPFITSASKKQPASLVKSSFKNLEVTNVKLLGNNTYEVTVRNGYQKDITAVSAIIPGKKIFCRDYISAESEIHQKLRPESSDEFLYALNPGEELVFAAVLFSDLTSEGDPQGIQEILDKRAGMKIQLARIKPYLEGIEKGEEPLLRNRLEKLRAAAESLPIKKDDDSPMSEALEYGLKIGRTFILKSVSDLQTALEKWENEVNLKAREGISNKRLDPEGFPNKLSRVKNDQFSMLKRL